MPHPLSHIVDTMADVEKEDLLIAALLVHPEDAKVLASNQDYRACSEPQPRPEWGGELIGQIWNIQVIVTPKVEPGLPDALPIPGGLRGIMLSLSEARATVFKYEPPPPPDPMLLQLQKLTFKTRSRLIKLLGGKPPFDPFTRVKRKPGEEVNVPRGPRPRA